MIEPHRTLQSLAEPLGQTSLNNVSLFEPTPFTSALQQPSTQHIFGFLHLKEYILETSELWFQVF